MNAGGQWRARTRTHGFRARVEIQRERGLVTAIQLTEARTCMCQAIAGLAVRVLL